MVGLLRANRRVESLVLCSASISTRPEDTVDSETTIQLLALRRIALRNCDVQVLHIIFSRIELPTDGVTILCDGWSPRDLPMLSILPSIEHSHTPPLLDPRALSISDRHRTSLLAVSDTSMLRMRDARIHGQPSRVPELHKIMALHAVRELRIIGGSHRSVEWWRESLGHMPLLDTLVLERGSPILLTMLSDPNISLPCPAPLLHTLVLIPHATDPQLDFVDTLKAVLAYRVEKGCGIRTLRVVCEGRYVNDRWMFTRVGFDALKEKQKVLGAYVKECMFDFMDSGNYPSLEIPSACQKWMDEVRP